MLDELTKWVGVGRVMDALKATEDLGGQMRGRISWLT